jgi:hypothetical protein
MREAAMEQLKRRTTSSLLALYKAEHSYMHCQSTRKTCRYKKGRAHETVIRTAIIPYKFTAGCPYW